VKRRRRLARRLLSACAIAAIAAALAAFGLGEGAFAGFQDRAADKFFPSAKTDPAVVVVGMDEPSLIEFGAPPWPRDVHAQIARRLEAAGAAVVVWDVVFFSSSENTSQRPDQELQTAELADALRSLSSSGATTILGVAGDLHTQPDSAFRLLDPDYPPVETLAKAANAEGHVKVETADGDGVVRSVPLVVETADGRLVPSLSLAAVLAYRGAQTQPVVGPKGVQAGGRLVPTEGDVELRLNFARGLDGQLGKRSFTSALDVYDGTVDRERFAGKIVLIGATAESARDNFDVPVNKSGGMPGVFIHANAVNTMLTASYLDVVSPTETVLWVAFLSLLVALAVLFLPLWLAAICSALLAFAYLVLAAMQFDNGHIMNLVYPYGLMLLAFFAALSVRYFTETRHRQRVSKLFAQYVPEAVAQ
jgi:adenylate cyclase